VFKYARSNSDVSLAWLLLSSRVTLASRLPRFLLVLFIDFIHTYLIDTRVMPRLFALSRRCPQSERRKMSHSIFLCPHLGLNAIYQSEIRGVICRAPVQRANRNPVKKGSAMQRKGKLTVAIATAVLAVLTATGFYTQDKYSLISPGGVAFSDFRGSLRIRL
jgi:hypothetical protein